MSRDIRKYWQEVRAIEERLPEFVWLVGIGKDSVGFVTEVPATMAARLLQGKSHRFATEDEISAHRVHEKQLRNEARHEKMRRAGAAVVVLTPEVKPAANSGIKSAPSRRPRR